MLSSNKDAKMADVYESLACFGLYSGDTFENKVAFIFKLFDFDNSNTIEKFEIFEKNMVLGSDL